MDKERTFKFRDPNRRPMSFDTKLNSFLVGCFVMSLLSLWWWAIFDMSQRVGTAVIVTFVPAIFIAGFVRIIRSMD